MKSRVRGGLALVAAMALIGVGVSVAAQGCAESKLKKEIAADEAISREKTAAAGAADEHATAIDSAIRAARASSTREDGTLNLDAFYSAVTAGLGTPADKAEVAKAVSEGVPADAAAAAIVARAKADAVKFAAEAKAASDAAAAKTVSLPAAREADTQSWTTGIGSLASLGNLFWPGVAGALGSIATVAVQKVRGTTFADGQTDGATQVAQAVATLRRAIPAVDHALSSAAPLLKKVVADSMDDNVAAAVAAHRDAPPTELQSVIASIGPAPAPPMAAAAA